MTMPAVADGPRLVRQSLIHRLLLAAGVLASVVYVAADLLCGWRYPGYSFASQVISELSAIGAPTADLWARLLRVFAVLFTAFAVAVVRHGARAGTRSPGPMWATSRSAAPRCCSSRR